MPSSEVWGPSVWTFFHTLAEKIKPEFFADNKVQVLKITTDICKNLPCPSCTQHATQYIEKMNTTSITCKEDLIMFFYNFHTMVNKRKHKPEFSYDELREKYAKANIINITNLFLYYYRMEHHAVRMIADDMHRKRSSKNIMDWLHANIHIFEM